MSWSRRRCTITRFVCVCLLCGVYAPFTLYDDDSDRLRNAGVEDICVVEPSPVHYYQVGGGWGLRGVCWCVYIGIELVGTYHPFTLL